MKVATAERALLDVFERISRVPLELASFVVVASIYVVTLLRSGYDFFYFDSGIYWQLGDLFERDGHFSLVAYDTPPGRYPRGYAMPLFNHVLRAIADSAGLGGPTVVKLSGALVAATLGVVVAPRLARQLFPGAEIGFGRVMALNLLLFAFWRDHLNFPLSDFPALLAAATGLLFLLRAGVGSSLLAGLGLGLAVNLRPAYLPALLAAVALAALIPRRTWTWDVRAFRVVLVIAGALVASLPQIAINHEHRGEWSPLVAGSRDLSLFQLSQGMLAQKYETFVGPSTEYPEPGVFYLDPPRAKVLEDEGISRSEKVLFGEGISITSYGTYGELVLRNPLTMAAGYVRRIFNGVDVRYATPYIRDLGDSSLLLSLLQYTLIFVALARLSIGEARRRLGPIQWAGVALLVSPCLTAIPGAVEPRFFLPLQLLIYMLVCFGPTGTAASLVRWSRWRRIALSGAYAAFVALCLWLSSSTRDNIEHPEAALPAVEQTVGVRR